MGASSVSGLEADAAQPLPGGRTLRVLTSEEWLPLYLSCFLLHVTSTRVPPRFRPGLVSLQLPCCLLNVLGPHPSQRALAAPPSGSASRAVRSQRSKEDECSAWERGPPQLPRAASLPSAWLPRRSATSWPQVGPRPRPRFLGNPPLQFSPPPFLHCLSVELITSFSLVILPNFL